MSYCSSDWRSLRPFRINVNKLVIIGCVGKIIDTRLVNFNPWRWIEFLSDKRACFLERSNSHFLNPLGKFLHELRFLVNSHRRPYARTRGPTGRRCKVETMSVDNAVLLSRNFRNTVPHSATT